MSIIMNASRTTQPELNLPVIIADPIIHNGTLITNGCHGYILSPEHAGLDMG
jgi:hypothetical protein